MNALQKFGDWLAHSIYGTAFKSFLAVLCGAVLLTWTSEGAISWDHYQTWLIGALAVAVPPLINYWNKRDTRFGRVKEDVDADVSG